MAFVLKDRVKETTTTTGTGSVTLAGASTGFQTFNSAIGTSNTTYYCIAGQGTSEWEVGLGTLSASTTLARTTVYASSNAGSLVNFSAGTKDVFVTFPASAGYAGATGQAFTSSGTFTIPTGITRVKATIVGGGGGGDAGTQISSCGLEVNPGSGGGAGGTAIKWFTSLTPGNTLSVTVGAGGAAAASGGTSSVASGTETITTVSATGGGAGSSGSGGSGGIGSSGDMNIGGGGGQGNVDASFSASSSYAAAGGCGGASTIGGGGRGIISAAGEAGRAYGGGGAGGGLSVSGGFAGGAGAAGIVIFEY